MSDDKFINPYNFVRPDRNVLRRSFVDFTRFHPDHYSGKIVTSIKSVGDMPIFIPDSRKKKYLILLDVDSVTDIETDKEYYFKINDKRIEKRQSLPEIKPIEEYKTPQELFNDLKERAKWIKGKLKQICIDAKGTTGYCIETDDPRDYSNKAHQLMEFCKDPNNNPIIPSTTIKGLIHNLVEILSNSCLAFYDKTQIYYRLDPDSKSAQREISNLSSNTYIIKKEDFDHKGDAIAVKLNSAKVNTSYFIEDELKNGSIWAAVVYNKNNEKPQSIKRISKEKAIQSCAEGLNKYFRRKHLNLEARAEKINQSNVQSQNPAKFCYQATFLIDGGPIQYFEPRLKGVENELLFARVLKKMVGPEKNFEKYYLKEINTDKLRLRECSSDESIVQCKLKRSGEIETKTQDILCFKYGEQDLQGYVDKASAVTTIDKSIVKQYNEALRQRKSNLKDKGKNEPESLKKGDLVFYNQKYLSYIQIPRKKYQYSIGDIVGGDPQIPKPCGIIGELCPVCNMFGSIQLEKEGKQLAISGKVFFGRGRLANSSSRLKRDVPLKILSSPKPSCTYFYLLNGDYNNPNSRIRGRKLYYHHAKDKLKHQRTQGDSKDDIIVDNQNVSVETLKNFEFKTAIDFVNLSAYELGLLLFALDLKNREGRKVYHKIGMGKPLGLGTIETEIDEENSFLIGRKKRYSIFLAQNGKIEIGRQPLSRERFISAFKRKQLEIYNNGKGKDEQKSDSYKIPYVAELFDILKINSLSTGHPEIKYPRKTSAGEPRGFEWFVDEQKRPTAPQTLPLSTEVKDKTKTLKNWS